MKKIFTLIIALLTFVMGTQTAQAYNEEEVVITGAEGDRLDYQVIAAMEATETIIAEYDDENNIQYYYSSDRKLLFTINSDNIITVASGVSSADDLICDPDNGFRQLYRIPDDVEFFELHFIQNPTKDMELTLMTGMNIEDPENEDTYMTIEALAKYSDELRCHKDEESGTSTYTTFAGKKLFSVTSDGMAIIEDNLTADDDINWTISPFERNQLWHAGQYMSNYMIPYKTIKLHFDTGIYMAPNKPALSTTLKTGDDIYDDPDTQTIFNLLWYCFGQLRMEAFVNPDDGGLGDWVFFNKDDKMLFTLHENTITLESDVTSADDIIYTITQEDLKRLKETDITTFQTVYPYSTIELHFKTNMLATLKTGINTSNEKNDEIFSALSLMLYNFNQLQMDFDAETGGATFLSMAGKELFTMNKDAFITLAPGITFADDIVYTITREDRNYLRDTNKELYDYLYGIKTIEIRFAPQTENMEAILRDGTDLVDEKNLQTLKVIQILVNSLNILSTGYRDGLTAIYSPSDKFLFTLTEEGIANVNQDLRVSDNIIYDITEEDRENLYYSDRDAYELLLDYKAIMLYFNYNDPDGIRDIKDSENLNDSWYTLDGRKLQGKPTQRGIYIKDGKKMLIK